MTAPRFDAGPMTGDAFTIAAALAPVAPVPLTGPDPLVDLGRRYFRLLDRHKALNACQGAILASLPPWCATNGSWIRDDAILLTPELRRRYGLWLLLRGSPILTIGDVVRIVRGAPHSQPHRLRAEARAEPMALFHEVLAMVREQRRLLIDGGWYAAGAEMDRIEPEMDELAEAIERTPARSIAGLVVKLRHCEKLAELDPEGPESDMMAAIIAEAEALADRSGGG